MPHTLPSRKIRSKLQVDTIEFLIDAYSDYICLQRLYMKCQSKMLIVFNKLFSLKVSFVQIQIFISSRLKPFLFGSIKFCNDHPLESDAIVASFP